MTKLPDVCGKCKAKKSALFEDTVYYGGHREKVLSCRKCGWHVPIEKDRPERQLDTTSNNEKIPCSGCETGQVSPAINRTGLCKKCGQKLRVWEIGKRTTPCPFVRDEQTKRLVPNPEKEIAAQKRKQEAASKASKVKTCTGCRKRKASPITNNLGLCGYCASSLKQWMAGKKDKPCPFIQNDKGQWVSNTEKANKRPIQFNFGETIFVDKNTTDEQLQHFASEEFEVISAVVDGEPDRRKEEEMVDRLHSSESFFRLLIKEKGHHYVACLFDEVERKNADRGYYVE